MSVPPPPPPIGNLVMPVQVAKLVSDTGKSVTTVVLRCRNTEQHGGILDLSDCDLASIPDAIYVLVNPETVTGINLENNNLHKIPVRMGKKLPNLTTLNLGSNDISQVTLVTENYATLECLDISHNGCETITIDLSKLKCLKTVKADGNQFNDESIQHLDELRKAGIDVHF